MLIRTKSICTNFQSSSIFQESDSGRNSQSLTQKNYSLTVIEAVSIPTKCIFDSMLKVKVNYKFSFSYTT